MAVRPICMIPARLASTRFPRKLLEPFRGQPILEHTRRRALLVQGLDRVIVATCDKEIEHLVIDNGGEVIMTGDHHPNGTSRVAEAIQSVVCTHVILVQADEPLIMPEHVEVMMNAILTHPECDVFNAVGPLDGDEELDQVSSVKCALATNGDILYCFRRSPAIAKGSEQRLYMRKLLGLIAFRKEFLLGLTDLPETNISQSESIEQMKLLQHGITLKSVALDEAVPGVNEPSDMTLVEACFVANSKQQACFERAFAPQTVGDDG